MRVIKSFFRDEQQMKLCFILIVSTFFCFALVGFRLKQIGFELQQCQTLDDLREYKWNMTFLFLVWNLFLAWIPYWIAISIPKIYNFFNSKTIIAIVLLCWLLFFPNAPYILTDLLHLKTRTPIPLWYDVMMILTFAWTGLMLGFLSLFEVQLFLQKFIGKTIASLMSVIAIFLCGIGIYIGRFQRWNSWDVVVNPFALISDVLNTLIHPMAYMRTLGLAVVISVFLLLGYSTIITLLKSER